MASYNMSQKKPGPIATMNSAQSDPLNSQDNLQKSDEDLKRQRIELFDLNKKLANDFQRLKNEILTRLTELQYLDATSLSCLTTQLQLIKLENQRVQLIKSLQEVQEDDLSEQVDIIADLDKDITEKVAKMKTLKQENPIKEKRVKAIEEQILHQRQCKEKDEAVLNEIEKRQQKEIDQENLPFISKYNMVLHELSHQDERPQIKIETEEEKHLDEEVTVAPLSEQQERPQDKLQSSQAQQSKYIKGLEKKIINGKTYEGEWTKDGTIGHGTITYASGSIYEGAWKNDNREGQGKATYASGSIYEGAWKNNLREGHGKYTYASGSIYEGAWKNDLREGHGKQTNANGDISYEGEWENGQMKN